MRPAEAYGYEPARVAQCTCGESKVGTLRQVNAWFAAHEAEGTEGVDHAIYIEDKETNAK